MRVYACLCSLVWYGVARCVRVAWFGVVRYVYVCACVWVRLGYKYKHAII